MDRKRQNNGPERRFLPSAEVRIQAKDGEKRTIFGYGAVFYDGTPETEYVLWDDQYGRAVERIMPGAFDGVLSRGDDVRGLFNHDSNQILGRTKSGTMRLSVDARGLAYEIDQADTTPGRDVAAYLERGDVSGSSFSFRVDMDGVKWTMTGDGDKVNEVREILSVSQLYDVGPVAFPAYETTDAGVRAAESVAEARKAREAWYAANKPPEPLPDVGALDARMENLQNSVDGLKIGI